MNGNGSNVRHHYPSIDDWVCHKHNSPLDLFKGKARCPRNDCIPWIPAEEIALIRGSDKHLLVVSSCHLLRNIRNRADEVDVTLLGYAAPIDFDSPDVVKYWHLFFGSIPASEAPEALPEISASGDDLVFISTMVGPVLEAAGGVFAGSGEPIKNGISLGTLSDPAVPGKFVSHLALVATWLHEPTDKEMKDAESVEVAQAYVNVQAGSSIHVIRAGVNWPGSVERKGRRAL